MDDTLVTPGMIFAGLIGAILWNLLTWLVGLPSSSSHALVGAAVAAGIVMLSRRNPVHANNVNDGHEVAVRTPAPATAGSAA